MSCGKHALLENVHVWFSGSVHAGVFTNAI